MLEAKIHKEITEYEAKIYLGMTGKQIICVLIACAITIPLFLLLYKDIGVEVTGYICMFSALPFVAVGFFKYKGIDIITIVKLLYNFYVKKNEYKCVNIVANGYLEDKEELTSNAKSNTRKKRRTRNNTRVEYTRFGYNSSTRRQRKKRRREIYKQLATNKK